MKNQYKVNWYALKHDNSIIEGRSLVIASDENEAAYKILIQKATEYHVRSSQIWVQSVVLLKSEHFSE